MAENADDFDDDEEVEDLDFGALTERIERIMHGTPGKKLVPVETPPPNPLPQGGR